RFNGGLDFNRSQEQAVRIDDDSALDFGSGSFTVAVWVKYSASNDGDILRKGSTNTASDWYKLEIRDGERIGFEVNSSEHVDTIISTDAYNDNLWHHVVGVRDVDAGRIKLFVDGVLVASGSNPPGTTSNAANLSIGSKDTLDDDFLNGVLDEVRLYNYAFSDAEVVNLFNLDVSVPIIEPTVETDPVHHTGSGADDIAIWIHPTDSSQSTVIGTDKKGGIAVYDLSGAEIQYRADGEMNNVDLRYNFPLGGSSVALVAATERDVEILKIYRVNPATRMLEDVAARTIPMGISDAYGLCMYHSASSGKYYAYVTDRRGKIEQWELFDNGSGLVDAASVRTFDVGEKAEGCVADDELGHLYIGEEDFAIWKYGAEPNSGTTRTQVDHVSNGLLSPNIEGLTIYYASNGQGYLIASSRGSDDFAVYERQGNNSYITNFEIVEGDGIDEVTGTQGIDVTNFPLGPGFPTGMFVAQDDRNSGNFENYKLVPYEFMAESLGLLIDTTRDPRGGAPAGDVTLPSAPGNLTATASGNSINLSWSAATDPDSGISSYNIYRDTVGGTGKSLIASVPGATLGYTDTPPTDNDQYFYQVSAVNGQSLEGNKSNEASALMDRVPAAPTGLTATPADDSISLDWADNSEGDLAGYNVYRSEASGGPYQKLNTGGLVATSTYLDGTVVNGTTYYYVVTAQDLAGQESANSSQVSGSLSDAPPSVPTGLSAIAGNSQVSLDWPDNGEGDLAGYNVYRSETPGSPYQKLNVGLVTSSSYLDGTVVNGATYYYVVTAEDLAGQESAKSAEVQILVSAAPAPQVYLTLQDPVVLNGGSLAVENEDIVTFDGTNFQMYFDGSDVGITAQQLDAIQILSPTEILMSFSQDGSVPGIALVEDTDIVRFTATSLGEVTAGTFDLYFHGRSVGLTSNDEDVDGVEILADGRMLVSTRGVFVVNGVSGDGKDLIAFTPTAPLGGGTTAGTWEMYFDGSSHHLTLNKEEVVGAAVNSSGAIYLSTVSAFGVTGVTGDPAGTLTGDREDIFVFNPATGLYNPDRWFDGSHQGLTGINIMGLDLP
ncbi:MAG: phytase, partial [Dehalococcoidia bacterium]